MGTLAAEHARARRSIGATTVVAYAGAASLVIAAVWYGLVSEGVTVDSEPAGLNALPFDERFDAYFGWFVTTFAQERLYTSFAIVGFLSVVATAAYAATRIAGASPLARLGALAVGLGAVLWVVGNVLSLGGHHVVEVMFARSDPRDDIYSVNLLVDLVDDGFELASFLVLGGGMLALAWAAMRAASRNVTWGGFSGVVGVALLVTAGAYAAQNYDLIDLMLVASGAVLVPAWLVWSGRLLRA